MEETNSTSSQNVILRKSKRSKKYIIQKNVTQVRRKGRGTALHPFADGSQWKAL